MPLLNSFEDSTVIFTSETTASSGVICFEIWPAKIEGHECKQGQQTLRWIDLDLPHLFQ